ncbi:MAG: hypothetical protein AAFX79_03570 [Planctomycetota bacterium]
MVFYAAVTSILVVVLFVVSVVFFFQAQAADRDYQELNEDLAEFVRSDERQRDDIRLLVQAASRDRKSLAGYLVDTRRDVMQRVTGVGGDSLEQLNTKIDALDSTGSRPLLQVAREAQNEVAALGTRLRQAEDALATAREDLANEVARVESIQTSMNATTERLTGEVEEYRGEVEDLRGEYIDARQSMDRRVEDIRRRTDDQASILRDQLDEALAENRRLEDQVRQLRGSGPDSGVRPQAEESLVDGAIIAVNDLSREVTINLGSQDKVTLGMTFAVFGSQGDIRVGPNGNYQRSKATIEIIRREANQSTARITSAQAGRPLIRGDVIANAAYDPNKVYKFVVFGNFDANGDGIESDLEARGIEATIRGWNGRVVPDLAGDVDFLVLGSKPGLPPEPDINATIEEIQRYQAALDRAERYDRLFEDAIAANLPVLNQNRLYTLIGKPFGDIR